MGRTSPSWPTLVIAALLLGTAWLPRSASALAADAAKAPKAEKPADCHLILRGKQIERLVLSNAQGKVINLDHPGDDALLPAGEYQIEEIEVQGGYIARWTVNPPSRWPPSKDRLLSLSPDKPCRPNIGVPLKASIDITASRIGRVVSVSYHLWLQGNVQSLHCYYPAQRDQEPPPKFAVNQGDREITASGAGSLEYG
jgi:hypothetical protein